MRPDRDTYFMNQLDGVAARSHDLRSKIGCKIVGPDGDTWTEGYNGLCRGIGDDGGLRLEPPEKYWWTEHAERNAIYNAARRVLKGGTLYGSFCPCMACARGIVQVGIERCVVDKRRTEEILSRSDAFVEDFKRSIPLLEEAKITLDWWEGKQ